MPAQELEIAAAEAEGVKIEYLAAPGRLIGLDGRVKRLVCQRMALGEFDSSGRRRPLPQAGSEFTLEVDQVIAAIGQTTSLDFLAAASGEGVELHKNGFIQIKSDSKSRAGETLIFAGGDVVSGPATVIMAIAAGRQAAVEIDAALRERQGEPASPPPAALEIDIPVVIDEEIREIPRVVMPEAPPAERAGDFREVELGLSPETAQAEACRCLRCDYQEETAETGQEADATGEAAA